MDNLDFMGKLDLWWRTQKEANKIGTIIFLAGYLALNVALFVQNTTKYLAINDALLRDPTKTALSSYAPYAKGFGITLDLNCGLIVVPLLRTVIRGAYNYSTKDQSFGSLLLQRLLFFTPLDKAIEFHIVVAWAVFIGAFGHTFFHFLNFMNVARGTLDVFGWFAFITGAVICVCMVFMYASTFKGVKHGHFEAFFYSHHLYIVFWIFLYLHGNGWFRPPGGAGLDQNNVMKWTAAPILLYIMERVLRRYRGNQEARLMTVVLMKPNVYSVQFAKEGIFQSGYKEGQYAFLNCPYVSKYQYHPFTISSAPQEELVMFHIRVMGEGSWTREVRDYLTKMIPPRAVYHKFIQTGQEGTEYGKVRGIDGQPLFLVDGPHSAPTQHISEYETAMIIGAGIGVTPLCSTLKSIIHYRWRFFIGKAYPDHAYFYWICSWRDLDMFRWMVRIIKEALDALTDMRWKNADMALRHFEMHIFVTSVPNDAATRPFQISDSVGFWGAKRTEDVYERQRYQASWTERELYLYLRNPTERMRVWDDCLFVHKGRPNWSEHFQELARRYQHDSKIGVAFCGNPIIARDLKVQCELASKSDDNRYFVLHKENF